MNDRTDRGNQQSDRNRSADDREMLNNIHADVHHIRRDFRDAIERSTTALLNVISALSAKVDRLQPAPGGGIPAEDEATAKRLRAAAQAAVERLKALDSRQ